MKTIAIFVRAALAIASASMLLGGRAQGAIAVDATASGNQGTAKTTVSTSSFSTTAGNELLLAFVSADQVSSASTTVTKIAGGGLTWVLVQRTNVQKGTAEIWRAFATSTVSAVTVTATLSQSVCSSITVMSFTGVNTGGTNGSGAIGATGSENANPGAPTATLVTTGNGSFVLGVGNDWDNAIARTVGPAQTLVHQYLAPVEDTYWVQMQSSATPLSGTSVTINDTAPTTDRYNLSIVEVLASAGGATSGTINGSISQTGTISGATVQLLQGTTLIATATVASNGSYSFSNVTNGTYTLQPGEAGYTFSPSTENVTVSGNTVTAPTFTATAAGAGWSIAGVISPSLIGSGAVVTLSGAASGTATANSAGDYSFTNLANGTYTLTPALAGTVFTPLNQSVTVNGANVTASLFTANSVNGQIEYPDLSDIIPTSAISIAGTGSSEVFQYTHDTYNGGPGPLVILPAYNAASGTYQGTQYIYSLNSSGTWTLTQTIRIAGSFIFDAAHGHFHFPFTTYGLYTVAANEGPGTPVATSGKISFCINDSFIYNASLPNAGELGNLGSCSDPTSLRGLDIGAVDEYDQTDEGQSISISGVPDGTYWLRAIVDPDNYLTEANKANNETDVEVSISAGTVTVLQTVTPVLQPPPVISVTAPLNGNTVTGTVPLTASTATTSGVQFLIDGEPLGSLLSTAPYSMSWDTTTATNGTHWLAAQTTGPTGVIGTSAVVAVTVSNSTTAPPTVEITAPTAGSTVSATITVSANAASGVGIANVTFYVDGTQIGTPVTAPPFMTTWDTEQFSAGQHTLTATAIDTSGNSGTSPGVTVTVDNSQPPNVIGEDAIVSVDGSGAMTPPAFTTSQDAELIIAFFASDGSSSGGQTATVTGAGLNWTLVERSNHQLGTAEIWMAIAPDAPFTVTGITAQAVLGSDYHGSLTVIAFTNASGPGIVNQMSAPSGAPDVYLPGVSAGNWVFAVGNDWDNAIARTPVSGQVIVHQRVDTAVQDTYWVQSTAAPSTANGLVDIHDSAPTTDQWNYAAVEIVATRQ